jgi:hypothetical protein
VFYLKARFVVFITIAAASVVMPIGALYFRDKAGSRRVCSLNHSVQKRVIIVELLFFILKCCAPNVTLLLPTEYVYRGHCIRMFPLFIVNE